MTTLTQHEETFRIKSRWLWLHRFLFGLMVSILYIPYRLATDGQLYPDLSQAPIFCMMLGFIWILWLSEAWKQTTRIKLGACRFTVKKWMQSARDFAYDSIEGYHEYEDWDRRGSFMALTVYLHDDYFTIRSIDFEGYDVLKDRLTDQRLVVTRQKVITRAERSRLRWLIGSLGLLIVANIVYAYVAHNPNGNQPAQLVALTSTLERIRPDTDRVGRLKGLTVQLSPWPGFEFYISRKAYPEDIQTLEPAIETNRTVRMWIRDSDYQKKLIKTEPLTFGDKHDDFKQIPVFGIDQINGLRLRATVPALEPVHTRPVQRTIFLSFLLLFCWAGWVYVDQQKVLNRS